MRNGANIAWYTNEWNTVGRARLTWEVMTFEERKKIAEHLYDEAKKADLGSVTLEIRTHSFIKNQFSSALALEELTYDAALMSLAAPYVALYYTSVGGTFDPANFAAEYAKTRN